MQKRDIIAGLIAGEAIAVLSLFVFRNLEVTLGSLWWGIPVGLPILSILGLFIASWLAKFWRTFWQLAKFLLVGVLNTMVDLGVLNLLILATGITVGVQYSIFKALSFIAAVINSYFWNKLWTFRKEWEMRGEEGTKGSGKEFMQFFIVSLGAFLANVGIASFIVNAIGPKAGLSPKVWANVAALGGVIISFIWNFLGYKFIVFRR